MSYLIDNKIGYNDMSDWGYDILRGADIGEEMGYVQTRNFLNNLK